MRPFLGGLILCQDTRSPLIRQQINDQLMPFEMNTQCPSFFEKTENDGIASKGWSTFGIKQLILILSLNATLHQLLQGWGWKWF